MTTKQKKMRTRIIIVLCIFAPLFILEHLEKLESINGIILFFMFFIPYLIIGYDVLLKAFKNIKNGQVFDENFLMMIATFAAFGIKEYEESLAVMLFYQIGELFQGYAVGKSRESIAEMMSIAPEFANLATEDGYMQVDPEDVEIGSILVIRPGEKIPLDGIVTEGESFVDTAALTGESVPRKVVPGDEVISGCINNETTLRIKTTKLYEDSTVSRILELVEDAGSRKAKLENFITRFARVYTPIVTIGALILALLPPIVLGGGFSSWIERACIFLIVSCPCALVISVPLGFFGGIGASSRIGVLIKGGNFLEVASYMSTIVFDKTGTLTKGEFKVSRIIPVDGVDEEHLLFVASHGEGFSSHPIAKAIKAAYEGTLHLDKVTDVSEEAGYGVVCNIEGKRVLLGSSKLMEKENIPFDSFDGFGTVIYVCEQGKFIGTLVISDSIKPGAKDAISDMKASGIRRLVMLTGDRQKEAQSVAKEIGIDEVHAKLLPIDKVSILEDILSVSSDNNKVGFVGDGINDAPVLMRADIGIAMGSMGSDAAIEAADIVIMDDDIGKIASVVKISKKTITIVKENIIFALGVKGIILVLGALGFASMWAAVFADVGVAVLAILNSMRTLRINRIH